MDYHARLVDHLAVYKEFDLGILNDGGPGEGHTSNVLPSEHRELNILATYRRPFRHFARANPMLRLGDDFHHLNSSQALCFNLFFPFVQDPGKHSYLLDALSLSEDSLVRTWFDHSFGSLHGDTFDFVIECGSGSCLFFDVKLAENWFGPAHKSAVSGAELAASGRKDIVGMVPRSLLATPDVAKYIVLLQKMAYVAAGADRRMVTLFPKANKELFKAITQFHSSLYPTIRNKLTILYLEDFIGGMISRTADLEEGLCGHYQRLAKKYLIDE